MDQILEALQEGSLIAWGLLILIVFVGIKLLVKAGKGFVIFLMIIGCFFVLMQFFPGIAEPIADFIGGGWMNDKPPFWEKQ